MEKSYQLYKGLKKPLVFKGFKGKYIYWAGSTAIGGLIASVLMTKIIGIFGFLVGFGAIAAGLWLITKTQKDKGIYKKSKNLNEIHMIPNRITTTKIYEKKNI
jgi:hypothetical protein